MVTELCSAQRDILSLIFYILQLIENLNRESPFFHLNFIGCRFKMFLMILFATTAFINESEQKFCSVADTSSV